MILGKIVRESIKGEIPYTCILQSEVYQISREKGKMIFELNFLPF